MQQEFPTRSTNPFDDEDNDEIFHDAQQEGPRRRSAPLNFDSPFDDVENPALIFDQVQKFTAEFVSPLESAMNQLGNNPEPTLGYSTFNSYHGVALGDDEITEGSPLIRSAPSSAKKKTVRSPGRHGIPTEISTGGNALSQLNPSTTSRRGSTRTKQSLVLTELASGENEFTMDYKYILLEDLGTASSWMILLLPYVTFFLSLILESSKSLKVTNLGPIAANMSCVTDIAGREPIFPAPTFPCYTSFKKRQVDQGHLDIMSRTFNKTTTEYSGTVFDSGMLPNIPVLSTDLYGDVVFQGLTSEIVALVSQRLVESSVVVLQQPFESDNSDWTLMFSSTPKTLTMACQRSVIGDDLWDCKSPRIVNVIFSMPDSAVYAGGNLRINVYYSLKGKPESTLPPRGEIETAVYTNSKEASSELTSTKIRDPYLLLENLVDSSVYTLEHMSDLAMMLDTGVRLGTFLISFCFVVYWCYSMGVHGLCSCCAPRGKKEGNNVF